MVHPLWCQFGNLGGQSDGGDMAGLKEGVVIGQLIHLALGDFAQFGAAIADVDAPQPRHAVDDLVAFAVSQPDALALRHDPRTFFAQGGVVGERVHVMSSIQRLKFSRRHVVGDFVHRMTP